MKKIVSILCIICLLVNIIPIYAIETYATNEAQDVIILTTDRNGNYTASAGAKRADKGSIIAKATEDEGIYHIAENKYITSTGCGTFQLTDKFDVDINNFEQSETIFREYCVPDKLKNEIEQNIEEQKMLGNDDLRISLFVPSKIDSDQISSSDAPLGTSQYTYKGVTFKDYSVKYWNCSTPLDEVNGSQAKSTASAFFNVLLSAAGVASQTISLFGVGISALSAYEAVKGTVSYGTQNDELRAKVIYDKIVKVTSWYMSGIWNEGLTTYKVWLNKDNVYQYYASTGNGYLHEKKINKICYSENFESPAKAIYDSGFALNWDAMIRLRICKNSYNL